MIVPVQKNAEFISDFQDADNVTGAIHVWWLGQSGFLIKWAGQGLLIDPYLSDSVSTRYDGSESPLQRISERVVDPLELEGINLVVCTSLQPDRLDPETILPLRAANPTLKVIVPAGIAAEADQILGAGAPPILSVNAGTYVKTGAFDFHGINAATPKIRRDEHGNSKELGFVILFGPFVIYHSGETIWHSQLIKEVRRWSVNLAFLPINGTDTPDKARTSLNGFEVAALSKAISASLVIPCHYDMFDVGNIDTTEFSSCCERLNQRHRILKPGQRMTMGPMTDPTAGKSLPSEPYSGDWGLGY
ncbi:MAG: MBL fold metallo-hydrolase [Verrucomicrobiales bacterium]|jgi:L-ascorbate metabolism protein UlaG (beta-lactamase superfamily)|nr:MBL fold metallo-hydrolase [Verrucomicrobiales bacterium]HQZ26722.1 MBL fold metallo-hydrolase [Verrucomicrobiales bacterium]